MPQLVPEIRRTPPPVAPPAAPRVREGDVIAALDLGTNNCRLLVARAAEAGFEVVDSFSRIVRLGEGLAAHGALSDRAMARTIAALRVCGRIMQRRGVVEARCVATEACRRASNGAAFLARIARTTGLRFELLPQDDEARLALLGCLPLIEDSREPVMMVDIGGGSIELALLGARMAGAAGGIAVTASLPLGVVDLAERFGREPDGAAYGAMIAEVATLLGPIDDAHGVTAWLGGRRLRMLGTSGTVTTLAALHLGLRHYDRRRIDGQELPFAAVLAVATRLRAWSHAARAGHPCIGAGRADLVVAGCAILEAIHRRWPVDELSVADRGLREGILAALVGASLDRPPA
jgi:exopolyphosphatase / guanosine-5'-triphosphate,3'-diphosphate pyrophosphatase